MPTSHEVLSLTQAIDDGAYDTAKRRLCLVRRVELDNIFAMLTPSERKRAYGRLKAIAQEYASELEKGRDRGEYFGESFESEMAPWRRLRDRRSSPVELPADVESRLAEASSRLYHN